MDNFDDLIVNNFVEEKIMTKSKLDLGDHPATCNIYGPLEACRLLANPQSPAEGTEITERLKIFVSGQERDGRCW